MALKEVTIDFLVCNNWRSKKSFSRMKYVELNLFPEEDEECEKSVGSKGNQEYTPSWMKDYDFTDLFDRLSKSNFFIIVPSLK